MALPTNKISVTDIDFDSIKANLKTFLESQSEFSDMNFEGAGLNVLLDVLAYNTHYTAMHASFLGNEMFLDSAAVRSSIVSLAKHLNYTPQSRIAPKALLDITLLPPSAPPIVTITKGTEWTGTKDGVTYTFSTIADLSVPEDGGNYIATGVEIFEGKFLEFIWTKDINLTDQRFIIPNNTIDISTITLTVQDSATSTVINTWNRAGQVTTINNTDKVYWLQEIEDSKFEIVFGNGVVGQALADGNVVKIEYLVTAADAANAISVFSAVSTIGGEIPPFVSFTTNTSAVGGSERETDASIKFLAPKLYQTQGRAVTIQDYKNILLEQRTDIEAIAGWGGEDNVPPLFGRVFLAIKPKNLERYSDATKVDIENNLLNNVNVVSIRPSIVDPDITYFRIATTVNYDSLTLNTTTGVLQTAVEDTVKLYFSDTLNKFEETFRFSTMVGLIDNTDASIKNNVTTFVLEKRFLANLSTPFTNIFLFNNVIEPFSLTSNQFDVGSDTALTIDDDGVGTIRLVKIVGAVTTIINANIGTIDYAAGTVTPTLTIDAFTDAGDDRIKVLVTSTSNDIVTLRDQILDLDENDSASLVVTLNAEI